MVATGTALLCPLPFALSMPFDFAFSAAYLRTYNLLYC